jgi:hypothetical protein
MRALLPRLPRARHILSAEKRRALKTLSAAGLQGAFASEGPVTLIGLGSRASGRRRRQEPQRMARGCFRGWRVHSRFCAAVPRGRSGVLLSYVPRLPGGGPGRIFRQACETGAPLC